MHDPRVCHMQIPALSAPFDNTCRVSMRPPVTDPRLLPRACLDSNTRICPALVAREPSGQPMRRALLVRWSASLADFVAVWFFSSLSGRGGRWYRATGPRGPWVRLGPVQLHPQRKSPGFDLEFTPGACRACAIVTENRGALRYATASFALLEEQLWKVVGSEPNFCGVATTDINSNKVKQFDRSHCECQIHPMQEGPVKF